MKSQLLNDFVKFMHNQVIYEDDSKDTILDNLVSGEHIGDYNDFIKENPQYKSTNPYKEILDEDYVYINPRSWHELSNSADTALQKKAALSAYPEKKNDIFNNLDLDSAMDYNRRSRLSPALATFFNYGASHTYTDQYLKKHNNLLESSDKDMLTDIWNIQPQRRDEIATRMIADYKKGSDHPLLESVKHHIKDNPDKFDVSKIDSDKIDKKEFFDFLKLPKDKVSNHEFINDPKYIPSLIDNALEYVTSAQTSTSKNIEKILDIPEVHDGVMKKIMDAVEGKSTGQTDSDRISNSFANHILYSTFWNNEHPASKFLQEVSRNLMKIPEVSRIFHNSFILRDNTFDLSGDRKKDTDRFVKKYYDELFQKDLPIDLSALPHMKESISDAIKTDPDVLESFVYRKRLDNNQNIFNEIIKDPEVYSVTKNHMLKNPTIENVTSSLDSQSTSILPKMNEEEIVKFFQRKKPYGEVSTTGEVSDKMANILNSNIVHPSWAKLSSQNPKIKMDSTFNYILTDPNSKNTLDIDYIPHDNEEMNKIQDIVDSGKIGEMKDYSPAAIASVIFSSSPKHLNDIKNNIPEHIIDKMSNANINRNQIFDELDDDHPLLTHSSLSHLHAAHIPDSVFYESVIFHPDNEKLFEMKNLINEHGGSLDRQTLKKHGYDVNQLGVNEVTSGRHITHDDVDSLINKRRTHSFNIEHGKWDSCVQNHNPEVKNLVMKFNLPEHKLNEIQEDNDVHHLFNKISDMSARSDHPVDYGKTAGWVRYSIGKDGTHIDEIQTDFSHKTYKEISGDGEHKQETVDKLHKILFDGNNPSQMMHSAFLQAHRDAGFAGKKVQIWNDKSKAGISLSDDTEETPVHMKEGYGKVPKKMGYEKAKYGELGVQQGEHEGKDTWGKILKKSRVSVKMLIRGLDSLLKLTK